MKNKKKLFKGIFDVLFILVACMLTLYLAMVFSGAVIVGDDAAGFAYEIKPETLIPIALIIVAYMVFTVLVSKKQLKKMYDEKYGDDVVQSNSLAEVEKQENI
ncbi:MAG: hypothetical protein LBM65_05400 [Oscillospiraceae bacterium]|nr:hypothetical protein [Oscillospiraceae bacterium]